MRAKITKLISIIILIFLISCFAIIGNRQYKDEKIQTDQEKMQIEYPKLPEDNNFKYLSSSDLQEFLTNGTGILYLANPASKWSQSYTIYLNDVTTTNNISPVYYYNIAHAKEINNRHYTTLVKKLEGNLYTTDDSENNLFTPMTVYFKDGEVIALDNETAIMPNGATPEQYWTSEKIAELKSKILNNYYLIEEAK